MKQVKFVQNGIEVDDQYVHLTRQEMNIFLRLYGSRGRVWNSSYLADLIGPYIDPSTLRVHVKNIRGKLGNNAIKNRRGHGYSIGDDWVDDTDTSD